MGTKLQYLGWDAFIITSPQGVRLLLDPALTGDAKVGIPASPIKPADVKADLVVISHGAADHLGNAFEILRGNPGAKLLGGVDIGFHAEKNGFGTRFDGIMEQMVSGCLFPHKDVQIRCLDARHISWTKYDGMPVTGTAMCYIIRVENGPTFFFGGDTSITYDFKLWGELYRPDVAMLGIGGGIQGGGRSMDELDPTEASIGADMLGCKLVIPMHYSRPDYLDWFHRECDVRLKNCKCLDMAFGETVEFGAPLPYKRLG